MNENPSGTFFIRHASSSGYGSHLGTALVALYGLVSLRAGIVGERLYPMTLERSGGGVAMRVAVDRGQRVPTHWGSDGETLSNLAQGQYWSGPDLVKGSGVLFLRRSGLPSDQAGTELYLAVTVLAGTEQLGLPNESLMDFVDGRLVASVGVNAEGMTPDQVLQQPFFRGGDGLRWAVRSTVGPVTRAVIADINRIFSMPEAERSSDDMARIEALRQNSDHRYFLKPYEGSDHEASQFRAFIRAMRVHSLPMDRLISAGEIEAHERAGRQAIRAAMEAA